MWRIITNGGGSAVNTRGVCWSTDPTPIIDNNKTIDGTGSNGFTSVLANLNINTTYYIRAYATNNVGTGYGNTLSFTTLQLPLLTTAILSNITQTTANCGGNISSNGGAIVLSRGVCWGSGTTPTIADNKTTDGTGNGNFISALSGLSPNTTYYVRAYATNSEGTGYGIAILFTTQNFGIVNDVDGNMYKTITIRNQIWMAENLKVIHYRNGDAIVTTSPATLDIRGESTPKYQWAFAGDESNVATYGRLYTWYAITDSRGVCPAGWHLPTHEEWATIGDYLNTNGYNYDGSATDYNIGKALASTNNWAFSTNIGSVGNTDYPTYRNKSGFTALPGGERLVYGGFSGILGYGYWWSSTSTDNTNIALIRMLSFSNNSIGRAACYKIEGMSVRCIKD